MDIKRAEQSVWNRTWSKDKGQIKPGSMDLKIFSEIRKVVELKDRNTIELGCGRGVLSYLMLQSGAGKVSLVDFSEEALKLARSLFVNKEARFIQADILELAETSKYGLVFSSGVVEHFSGQLRGDIINKHLALSRDVVVIVVPARPHYNTIRHKKKRIIRLYGWQEAFSKDEMKGLIEKNKGFKVILNKRFFPLYGINIFELLGANSDKFIAKCWNFSLSAVDCALAITKIYGLIDLILKPLANYIGGLLIAVATKNSTAEVVS